jgi:hypothetical protein
VNCPKRRCAARRERSTIQGVSEEEAARILGPFLTAILRGLPTPPVTVEQVELLIRLLTGHGPEPGRAPLFWPA